MNRFFSKLNLQDIKINPEGNHFPPDEDEQETEPGTATQVAEPQPEPATDPYAPLRETPVVPHQELSPKTDVPTDTTITPDGQLDIVQPNGHATEDHRAAVEFFVDDEGNAEVLKVSARSRPSAVAGAIAGVVRETGRAEVQAIGAGATNQAVKAVAIARDYLSETGIDAVCVPAFIDVTIENEDRTAIRLVVEPR